tara:strand:- start:305 stop:694 length:390 start_codon:yes stop_codon:yes gene_type:complete
MQDILEIKPMRADIDENTFITELSFEEMNIFNTPDYEIKGNEGWEYPSAFMYIKWQLNIEYRKYGIKDISAYSVQAQIVFDDGMKELLQVDTYEMDDWTIEDGDLDIRNNIHPKHAHVDVENKSIYLEW